VAAFFSVVKQDRSAVEYTRGTNSMILPNHIMTPTTSRVAESLEIPTGSPVVVLKSRKPKAPKVVRMETKKKGTL
jgi:hypothetical protein